ncbi:MAG: DUF2157 domain-containing protein [Theionarchaea archaeon]|nr:DUF2157 domain-containing protein [Theionarchaea archaeon]MBU7037206.1 DUF2157 domain-containing protein [Theionarchaea archaeon]
MEQKETWLEKEVAGWETEGIITEYQARAILSKYGLAEPPTSEKTRDKSRLTTVVSVLGAFLIGIGAILAVASNWEKIPDSLKLLLSTGTTFATYVVGWSLKYDTRLHPRVGSALLFLGSILVGATLFLIAQIFNVNAGTHWLVFLWFVAISPLGYGFNQKSILGLNIFTAALWMILYASNMRQFYQSTFETFMLYLLFGMCLYGLGQVHTTITSYAHFRLTYQNSGLFFILLSYFYFSLRTAYERIFAEIGPKNWTLQLLFILFGTTALLSIGYTRLRYKEFRTVRHEFYILLLAFSGWVGVWLLTIFRENVTTSVTYGNLTYTELSSTVATLLFVVFTVMFFALSIGSILIGYYKAVTSFVNLGMSFFVLGILHLYFTTLYRFLPRALAFITGGFILLGMGWYLERKRRSLIQDMEARHE